MTDTKKNKMPDEIYAYEDNAEGFGGHWFDKPAPVDDGSDTVKYTRLDPDDIVISRKELEGMRKNQASRCVEDMVYQSGFNTAIDKILEIKK